MHVSIRKLSLLREAMHSAVFAVVRCPSVRLSVCRTYCVETAKLTIKRFSSPGGPISLVFPQTVKVRRGHPQQDAK